MATETRVVFQDASGQQRPFLKVSLQTDGSVIISPASGVPGLMRSWEEPLRAEVLNVTGIHLSVHANGEVHIRENGKRDDLERLSVPPLRDFAAASYFLHVLPGPMASYAPAAASRATDTIVDVADVEAKGFRALLAVGVLDSSTAPVRESLPGLNPNGPPRAMRITRKRVGELEVQVAVVWLVNDELPPPERETWALVRLPDGGDHLPRPIGGTASPSAWERRATDPSRQIT